MPEETPKDWFEYHVVESLKKQDEQLKDLRDEIAILRTTEIPALKTQLAELKERARNWGAAAGLVVAVVVDYIKKHVGA